MCTLGSLLLGSSESSLLFCLIFFFCRDQHQQQNQVKRAKTITIKIKMVMPMSTSRLISSLESS